MPKIEMLARLRFIALAEQAGFIQFTDHGQKVRFYFTVDLQNPAEYYFMIIKPPGNAVYAIFSIPATLDRYQFQGILLRFPSGKSCLIELIIRTFCQLHDMLATGEARDCAEINMPAFYTDKENLSILRELRAFVQI